MDIAKQIIDQRIYKIIADNPERFFHKDIEKNVPKYSFCWALLLT